MKKYAPDYYKEFRCIAGKCLHSCCIGWEIDIDDDTLEIYKSTKGNLGRRFEENIVTEADGTSHFCLGEKERCPFLNDKNLCDIYTELGEDALCQICSDHPRFRNYYSDREETGLGLCCEAAGKLILSCKNPVQLICTEDDGEEMLWEEECDFLDLRDDIFDILQNRSKHIFRRIEDMLKYCETDTAAETPALWAEIFAGLERLDKSWDILLGELKEAEKNQLVMPQTEETEIALEQLAVYFVYRHLADSLDDGRLAQRVKFAALSCKMIYWLWAVHYSKTGMLTLDDMVEICRIYSSEVEYSDDNMEQLFDILGE